MKHLLCLISCFPTPICAAQNTQQIVYIPVPASYLQQLAQQPMQFTQLPLQQVAIQPAQEAQPKKDSTPEILNQIGAVVMNFVEILKDPKNTTNACVCASNMLQGMLSLPAIASRKIGFLSQEGLDDFLKSPEGEEFIAKWRSKLAYEFFDLIPTNS